MEERENTATLDAFDLIGGQHAQMKLFILFVKTMCSEVSFFK